MAVFASGEAPKAGQSPPAAFHGPPGITSDEALFHSMALSHIRRACRKKIKNLNRAPTMRPAKTEAEQNG